ncbi:unnamed protein product [Citrullus colocynthis]|uniref:Uncharacterized protein n=1 Tax=Citrullus colocynthis TaxID=252529 RepID=A0ABP0ZDR6_9ROSI
MADFKHFLGFRFSIFLWVLISTTVAVDDSLEDQRLAFTVGALAAEAYILFDFCSVQFLEASSISLIFAVLYILVYLFCEESKIDERDYDLRRKQKGFSDNKEHSSKEYTLTHELVSELKKQSLWNESGGPRAYTKLLERKAQVSQ